MSGLGILVVGFSGAISTTVQAGVRLMSRGKVPRRGMLTEASDDGASGGLAEILDFAPLDKIVFGGWDIHDTNSYDACLQHGVFRADQLADVKDDLTTMRPWPAVFCANHNHNLSGKHIVEVSGYREQIKKIQDNIESFKKEHNLDNVVMVNVASTETWLEQQPVHETLSAFEKGLDNEDASISPAMRYVYAANACGVPHANFTPSLSHVPALEEHAKEFRVPYAGMDGKTGQTLVKTALGSMFRARNLTVNGWYSTNILGNNDGAVLDDPSANKTKVMSKASVLDSIVGYKVQNHQVHIHYYKPRGDAKEAWDNIDLLGFCDESMQMKIDFLCKDSILAAPLIVDIVRILDVAKQRGERGVVDAMGFFFKSPYTSDGEPEPMHDLFKQEERLFTWARNLADTNPTLKVANA